MLFCQGQSGPLRDTLLIDPLGCFKAKEVEKSKQNEERELF